MKPVHVTPSASCAERIWASLVLKKTSGELDVSSIYFVVAGNHQQFSEWRRLNATEMLLNNEIKSILDIVYVASPEQLRGYSNPKGIFTGTWHERKDIRAIIDLLRIVAHDQHSILQINRARDIVGDKDESTE